MSIETAEANTPEKRQKIDVLAATEKSYIEGSVNAADVKTKLEMHRDPSGRQVIVLVLEKLDIIPDEVESAEENIRKAWLRKIDGATFEYLSEYFKEGASIRVKLDIDKIEELTELTKEYNNSVPLAAIQSLRENNELQPYNQQLIEADRIARILIMRGLRQKEN